MRCPKGHILSETKSVFSCKYGVYKKYKCECNDRYIYAPNFPKTKVYIEGKKYFIINLSCLLSELKNWITFDKDNNKYKYKYYDNQIIIGRCKNRNDAKCDKCMAILEPLDFLIPKKILTIFL